LVGHDRRSPGLMGSQVPLPVLPPVQNADDQTPLSSSK
jgi:hypothetical protein